MKKNYGGLEYFNIDLNSKGEVSLTDSPYSFKIISLNKGDEFKESLEGVSIIFPYKNNFQLTCDGKIFETHDMRIISADINIKAIEAGYFLLAKTLPASRLDHTWEPYLPGKVKEVKKPWGNELWFEFENSSFALKKLFIKAGTQTSLQFHEKKLETMVFVNGQAEIAYKSNSEIDNREVVQDDLSTFSPETPFGIHIKPHNLHRITAITDVTMYEMSTLNLDDVIRVQDDSNRSDGYIASEHS